MAGSSLSLPDPECVLSPDLQQQAIAALLRIAPQAQEQAGVLYRTPDGQYCWTQPVTTATDRFDIKARMPAGATLAAIYHSHSKDKAKGPRGADEKFSEEDVSVANNLKVPSYIRILRTGDIKRYTPGQTKVLGKTAEGDPVEQAKRLAAAIRGTP